MRDAYEKMGDDNGDMYEMTMTTRLKRWWWKHAPGVRKEK
jgi:hypothetical protein